MSGVPGLATAADYSEAMGVARRAKSALALLILLMLVAQLTTFFLVRYNVVPMPGNALSDATTQPASEPTRLTDIMHYLTGLTLLGGIGLGIVLALVMTVILHIMLVGRLIGVGKVTCSLVWCGVLVVFLFPWQTFMNNAELSNPDFRIPGVLWTWSELAARYNFANDFTASGWAPTILGWFRFVGAPVVAIIVTLIIQLKSNRGIKMAMGEDEVLNDLLGANQRV
jgi:hypothetical protein